MSRDRAAYMREYRARKSARGVPADTVEELVAWQDLAVAKDRRIVELEEEVRHLKAELAKRPSSIPLATGGNQYSTRPFTPVPKK